MVKDKVADLAASLKCIEIDSIDFNCPMQQMKMDTLDLEAIITDLESEFDVLIEENANFSTLGDLVGYVEELLHAA